MDVRILLHCVSADDCECIVGHVLRVGRNAVKDYGAQVDVAIGAGFDAEQCVVYAAEFRGGDQYERQAAECYIVDGEHFIGERNHETAGDGQQELPLQ